MVVVLGTKEFDISNIKLETIMKSQKAQFNDVIVHYKEKNDIQGLMYILFCMKHISESVIEELIMQQGVENIGDIIAAET